VNDAPIKPIRPVRATGPIREIGLRRRAALFQLRQWLDFVKTQEPRQAEQGAKQR